MRKRRGEEENKETFQLPSTLLDRLGQPRGGVLLDLSASANAQEIVAMVLERTTLLLNCIELEGRS